MIKKNLTGQQYFGFSESKLNELLLVDVHNSDFHCQSMLVNESSIRQSPAGLMPERIGETSVGVGRRHLVPMFKNHSRYYL